MGNLGAGFVQGFGQTQKLLQDFEQHKALVDLENKKMKLVEQEWELKAPLLQAQAWEHIRNAMKPQAPTALGANNYFDPGSNTVKPLPPAQTMSPEDIAARVNALRGGPGNQQGNPGQDRMGFSMDLGGGLRATVPPGPEPGANVIVHQNVDGTVVTIDKNTGVSKPVIGPGGSPLKTAQPLTPTAIATIQALGEIRLPANETEAKAVSDAMASQAGGITGARETQRITVQSGMLDQIQGIAQARAAGMVSGGLSPDVPLSPQASEMFGIPFGATWRDVQGQVASNPKARLSVNELKVSENLLNNLSGYADKLITAKTWGEAMAQGAKLWVGAASRANTDAATFADQREALLGVFSRQIGAERGVLTDRDIFRLDKALPNFRDTKDIKDKKLALLRSMIQANKEARVKAISSFFDADSDMTVKFTQAGANPSKPPTAMSGLPDAEKNVGRIIRNLETGARLKSNGVDWVPVPQGE